MALEETLRTKKAEKQSQSQKQVKEAIPSGLRHTAVQCHEGGKYYVVERPKKPVGGIRGVKNLDT